MCVCVWVCAHFLLCVDFFSFSRRSIFGICMHAWKCGKCLKRNLRLNGLFIAWNRHNVMCTSTYYFIWICYGCFTVFPNELLMNRLAKEKSAHSWARIPRCTSWALSSVCVCVCVFCQSFIEATKLSPSVKSINKMVPIWRDCNGKCHCFDQHNML